MACLLKAPSADWKGVVVFTTPERDQVIAKSAETRSAIEALKKRFVIGLHHNWHDYSFRYDPLFDFSMAGDDDLQEVDGRPFPRIPLDACNFAPPCFAPSTGKKFWDVLCISRAVSFKNIPDIFATIRSLYDAGHKLRVLYLCPVPVSTASAKSKTDLLDIRARFEALFPSDERRRFTLMTMDFDYPFPLDLETLAFFYAGSRVFLHQAAEERRVRVAGYSWASGLPVIAHDGTASLLSAERRQPPFYYNIANPGGAPAAILAALAQAGSADLSPARADVASVETRAKLIELLRALYAQLGVRFADTATALEELDIRLGRHHATNSQLVGPNHLPLRVMDFVGFLGETSDEAFATWMQRADPEAEIAAQSPLSLRRAVTAAPVNDPARQGLFRRLFR